MTKKEIAQAEAVKTLKDWGLKDGTIVWAKVVRVSSSGMSRQICLYMVAPRHNNISASIFNTTYDIKDITYWSAQALGWGYGGDGYRDGIKVSGCGMDMLFHTINQLSYAMGYGSICQNEGQTEPTEKTRNGEKFLAIGLKYRQL